MSSRITRHLEAANALLALSRSENTVDWQTTEYKNSSMRLRDRSKIDQPKPYRRIYSSRQIVQPATVATEPVVPAVLKPIVVSTRQLRDRSKLKTPNYHDM